jgi:methionyl-tRNA formyltransferase
MKILLFSGSHPRHLFVHKALVENFDIAGVVLMRREEMLPEVPAGTSAHDAKNFRRHFADRLAAEQKYFGDSAPEKVFNKINTWECDKETLNNPKTVQFIESVKPDLVFLFGSTLIKAPIFPVLPHDRVNLHLGLSPWYKGTATLFWPFYNLEPQFAGSTIHQITKAADAGAIIHQIVPKLERGDGIHDVACKTVIASTEDLVALFKKRGKEGRFTETPQRSSGRLYLKKDFRPEHLRLIYDLYQNKMVDAFLSGEISGRSPSLISGLSPE